MKNPCITPLRHRYEKASRQMSEEFREKARQSRVAADQRNRKKGLLYWVLCGTNDVFLEEGKIRGGGELCKEQGNQKGALKGD